MQPSPPANPAEENPISRPIRRSQRTPHRAQINLKSRRKKNIPEIKIQLDGMLSQAFHQIHMQPKKNARIGNTDLFVLDNNLLRDYVEAVYDQYGIQDPLGLTASSVAVSNASKIRSNSNYGTRMYQTPEKQPVPFDPNYTKQSKKSINSGSKNPIRVIKTTERLTKLKQNFQSELQTLPTTIFQDEAKTAQKSKEQENYSAHVREATANKKPQIRLTRRPSQVLQGQSQSRKLSTSKQSYLLVKTKHKYCLMCEQPLQNDLINSHEKQCPELQRLLNTSNLKIEQIQQILNSKIAHLEQELQYFKNIIHEDAYTVQELLNQINRKHLQNSNNNNNDQNSDQEQENGLCAKFSMLSTVRCMEMLDKLKWFRKMKSKAQVKKSGAM